MELLYLQTIRSNDLARDMFRGNLLESPYNTYIKWTSVQINMEFKLLKQLNPPEHRILVWASKGLN